MTDTEKLKQIIADSGYKVGFVAEYIGLTPQGFGNKLNNRSEFRASEIQGLCELLAIKNLREIFFATKVGKMATKKAAGNQ